MCLFSLALGLLTLSGASAATLRVPTLEYPGIADGVAAAAAGDTVLVAPGVYTGKNNRNITFGSRNFVLASEGGAEVTTVDVQGNAADPGRGFLVNGGQSREMVIDGFTIINGWMSAEESLTQSEDARHDLSAGGLKVSSFSSPTIRNMIIRQCHSQYTGGGISVEVGGSPLFQDCLIQNCTAGIEGGGIAIEFASAPVIERCVVTGNRANKAGGIACHSNGNSLGEAVVLESCTISGNRAGTKGGGIVFNVDSLTSLRRTILWGNCADKGGDDAFYENASRIDVHCSLVDTTAWLLDPEAQTQPQLTFDAEMVFGLSPKFCEGTNCLFAPNANGDYGVASDSPCLEENSPCGERIGALGTGGCVLPPATIRGSWGSVKAAWGSSAGD